MAETNPNGANGTTSDPREQVCWDYYLETLQAGQTNAYQSAIKAGYSESSATTITTREWFKERLANLKRKSMLSKAERNLDKVLDYEVENDKGIDKDLLRIQVDVSKFITGTQGKEKGYSNRTELTGANGKDLPTPIMEVERAK